MKSTSTQRLLPLALPLAVFFLPLTLYLRTLAPTITAGDGPELTAAAFCLGIPHPTGYPLYMLLGHLWINIIPGSPAFAMNLFSAFWAALACLGMYKMQREIWRQLLGRRKARSANCLAIAAAAALLAGAGTTWWDHANQTEVYAMFVAILTWTWAAGLRAVRKATPRTLAKLALLTGVGLLHHLLILVALPMLAAAFWRCMRAAPENHTSRLAMRLTVLPALLLVLPLVGYAYLPLRAATNPPINSGNPQGLHGVIDHLTGAQYRQTRVLSDASGKNLSAEEIGPHIINRIGETVYWLGAQCAEPRGTLIPRMPHASPGDAARAPLLAVILLLLAALGTAVLHESRPASALALLGGGLLNLVVVVLYTIPDIGAYRMPLWILTISLASIAPVTFPDYIRRRLNATAEPEAPRRQSRRALGTIIAALGLSAMAITHGWNPAYGLNKAEDRAAMTFARGVFKALPENAVVFTNGDYDIYPLWYMQVCENARPDVAVVGANFVLSGWYRATLRAQLPPGVEVFVGNEPPSTSDRWLVAFLGGMVAPQFKAGREVYMTHFHGSPEVQMVARHYDVRIIQQFPPPLPVPGMPPLTLYRLQDPRGFSARAREALKSETYFPNAEQYMVRGNTRSEKQ